MSSLDEELASFQIPLEAILTATDNFADENLLKQGGKANIYKGMLLRSDEEIDVVIRKYNSHAVEFYKEIRQLACLRHRYVVPFVGFCDEKDKRMIVMEQVVSERMRNVYDTPVWSGRLHICFDAALALKKIHDAIRSFKLLLYTENSDLDCLGVILFGVLCARKATPEDVDRYLAKMAENHNIEDNQLDDMIPSDLRTQLHLGSLSIVSEIVYNCLKEQPDQQTPYMFKQAVKRLKEAFDIQWKHENHLLGRRYAPLKISLGLIMAATDNFATTHSITANMYERVYKAELVDYDIKNVLTKKKVIIKHISSYEKLSKDFFVEIEMLKNYKHPNLLSLTGFCNDDSQMILVFECAFKETLNGYLKSTSNRTNLTWEKRIRICLDIAHGLNYLYNKGEPNMITQGILSANVFLDENWTAMIANYRLSDFYPYPISVGQSGQRRVIDDIYFMGVILFEILTGRLAYDPFYIAENVNDFASMARGHFKEGTLKKITDPRIMKETQEIMSSTLTGPDQDSFHTFSEIAYQCLEETPSKRPALEDVIKSLDEALRFQNAYEVWGPLRKNYKETIKILEKWKIPLEVIHLATDNFDKKYHIASGGYARVYKAELNYLDIPTLAIKMKSTDELSKMQYTVAIKRIFSKKDNQENPKLGFLAEFDVACRCEHPNIISFLGCCVEGGELLLVYEYASNGSLDDYLVSTDKMVNLTWAQRLQMCIGIAHGLNYLHTNMEGKRRIIHRDIKSANILLGENCEAKIADFGLSKIHHGNQEISTINTTTLAGTHFYCDPEYARTGKLKNASDIYSLGVVLLEIFSGKLAYDKTYMVENAEGLVPIAQRHFENGTLQDILDYKMLDEVSELGLTLRVRPDHDSLELFSKIACQCLERNQDKRPTTEVIIHYLKEALQLQENRRKTLRISFEQIKSGVENFSDGKCIMRGGYGILYKGTVQDHNRHKKVVVKRFTGQEHGFLKEFEVLFKYKQENIISLVGYCKEMEQKIIVYEDASNGCLSRYLNDSSFSWTKRLKICIDIANGLKFLHGGDLRQDVVIHRDLKSSNVLLTDDWKAKVCGFEFALINPTYKELEYDINDAVVSAGYCDPLYWETKVLTKESDIYSFGVILFEILCGRLACPEDDRDQGPLLLDDLVKSHREAALLVKIVFDGIKKHIAQKSFAIFQEIAFQCLEGKREERPRAGDVVIQLQKALEFQEVYEKRKAKLDRTYEEILHEFPENYPTMRKRRIYNILSKEILEDDKLLIGEHAEDYHSDS